MFDALIKKILSARVYDVAKETPVHPAPFLSKRLGRPILLKREDLQPVYSFKCRGAYNKMAGISGEVLAKGVIAASAGNHAQGVALGAQKLKIPAVIVMPTTTPAIKVRSVKARGAQVVLHGDSFDEAFAKSQELVADYGYTYLHPFDDLAQLLLARRAGEQIAVQLVEQVEPALGILRQAAAAFAFGVGGGQRHQHLYRNRLLPQRGLRLGKAGGQGRARPVAVGHRGERGLLPGGQCLQQDACDRQCCIDPHRNPPSAHNGCPYLS